MKNKASVALALCAVLSLALIGSASAGVSTPATVKIRFTPVSDTKLRYSGRIKAENPDCARNRRISFRAGGKLLAKARTDSEGKFSKLGKRPRSGATIKIRVKRKSRECPKLVGDGKAP